MTLKPRVELNQGVFAYEFICKRRTVLFILSKVTWSRFKEKIVNIFLLLCPQTLQKTFIFTLKGALSVASCTL